MEKIKNLIKNPMLIIFIAILLFFTPKCIFSAGQNRDRGVVIAVGIDKNMEEYEISLLTFIPTAQQSFEQMNSVISGKGETIAKALYNAQIAMGREIGLSHAKTTVVNLEFLQEDVAKYIDYLSRVATLSENTVFVCTDKSAKEFLEASNNLESSIGLQLEQIIGYNAENLYVNDTSLEAFYKGYYSREKSSLIGFLSVDDGKSGQGNSTQASQEEGPTQIDTAGTGANDISSSSSGSGSSQSSGSQGQESGGSSSSGHPSPQIVNKGEAVLLREGKMVEKLTVDQLNGINLLNTKSKNQILTIKGVEKDGEKFDYSYRVKNKRINVVTEFENGYPVYAAQLGIELELIEIKGEHEKLKLNTEFSTLNQEEKSKIDAVLKEQFKNSIELLKKNKSDVTGINDTFYKNNRKKYNKFIDDIGGVENFLDYVIFKVNFVLESG